MSGYKGHTPGPWNQIDFDEVDEIGSAEEPWIATSALRANTRLIADAPMLADRITELEEEVERQRELLGKCRGLIKGAYPMVNSPVLLKLIDMAIDMAFEAPHE